MSKRRKVVKKMWGIYCSQLKHLLFCDDGRADIFASERSANKELKIIERWESSSQSSCDKVIPVEVFYEV